MERTSPWAALYFVALMTFGNYVLFNLLVAILVEGFSSEVGRREAVMVVDRGGDVGRVEVGVTGLVEAWRSRHWWGLTSSHDFLSVSGREEG